MQSLARRIWLGLALVNLCAASCATDSPTEMALDPALSDADATFTFVQEQVLDISCATSGCHAGYEFPDLRAANAYANIVGIPSSQGMPLVDPGRLDNSYLYLKIIGANEVTGAKMPPPRSPGVSAGQIAAVKKWIERGAPND